MWQKFLKHVLWAAVVLILSVLPSRAQSPIDYSDFSKWQTIRGEHFVVYFYDKEYGTMAAHVLSKAEGYYDKVAYQIGYARYGNFWTWEDRVKIFIFPDRFSFFSTTGQKQWSKGYAVRDSKLFESRAIVTFKQEDGFVDNLLPHEIGHLIVKDFIGFDRPLPVWFDEGVAQQQEILDSAQEQAITSLTKSGQYIPFDIFQNLDIRRETDEIKVAIFYAQSRSVIEFLIKVYGQDAFQRMCINLRDGMDLSQALSNAYPASIESVAALGQKWVRHMQDK